MQKVPAPVFLLNRALNPFIALLFEPRWPGRCLIRTNFKSIVSLPARPEAVRDERRVSGFRFLISGGGGRPVSFPSFFRVAQPAQPEPEAYGGQSVYVAICGHPFVVSSLNSAFQVSGSPEPPARTSRKDTLSSSLCILRTLLMSRYFRSKDRAITGTITAVADRARRLPPRLTCRHAKRTDHFGAGSSGFKLAAKNRVISS